MLSASRNDLAGASGTAAGGPLENTANNSSPSAPNRASRRRDRWLLRTLLWSLSSLQRSRHCGRVTRSTEHGPTIRYSEGVAGFAGLQHCGSVWACPVCSASILTHRALEIGSVLGAAIDQGHALGFGTLTMRHRQGQPLKALWSAAGSAWARATSGKQWQAVKLGHGVTGWVRVWEVTDGRNGWHVHVHFVVVLDPGATPADLDAVCSSLYRKWSKGLVDAGLEAPRLVGQEWHMVTGDDASTALGEYLFKLTESADHGRALGLELAHTQPGRARADLRTRPVWQLLHDITLTGDLDGLDRWREWEQGSKGKRQVGWSKGLREQFAPAIEDVTDEAIADREVGSSADDVAVLSVDGWRRLVARRGACVDVLEALEVGGIEAMATVLDEHGIEWMRVSRDES